MIFDAAQEGIDTIEEHGVPDLSTLDFLLEPDALTQDNIADELTGLMKEALATLEQGQQGLGETALLNTQANKERQSF